MKSNYLYNVMVVLAFVSILIVIFSVVKWNDQKHIDELNKKYDSDYLHPEVGEVWTADQFQEIQDCYEKSRARAKKDY